MLAQYIDTAMELAAYEIIEDDGSYWGESPEFKAFGPGTTLWRAASANCARH